MSTALIAVLIVAYLALGVISFVGELIATSDGPGEWKGWPALALFVALLFIGAPVMLFSGIVGLPWALGFVCGLLVEQFKAGFDKARRS